MSENATRPMRARELIRLCRTAVIVRFDSGLMLRETSSTTTPPESPESRPLAAAALPRPVSLAPTASPTSTAANSTRNASVRRTAGASSRVVASGIVGPRNLRSVPIRPLFDHVPDVERQRLRHGRQRRRLAPGKLARDERQLGLAAVCELEREQLERLALLRGVARRTLDERDRTLERAEDAEPQPPGLREPQQREQPGREEQARSAEQQSAE